MTDIAIKFENISKQYRLGLIGTGTLSHDLNRWWAMNIIGKDDPNLRIGQVNDRSSKATEDYVWALRNIDFEVKQGEVLGIIGKNGAGKSTLLKILSRVTNPTTGRITARGRIASLLEVGTGFHPEMTGRENIFMNGSIMGMRKTEITRKLDEIVDFAGVDKYIDTPVKRYSSGMTVRLGFAIAAHLEPEILIVDEVLAVGDAEFQKKAIGKIQDVGRIDGRTVLFVSHNMTAITSLCMTGILLINGTIKEIGNVKEVVTTYLNNVTATVQQTWSGIAGDEDIKVFSTKAYSKGSTKGFYTHDEIIIEIEGEVFKPIYGLVVGFHLWSIYDYELAYILHEDNETNEIEPVHPGIFKRKFRIPSNMLAEGQYKIQFDIGVHNVKRVIYNECNLTFTLSNIAGIGQKYLIGTGKGISSLIRTNWSF